MSENTCGAQVGKCNSWFHPWRWSPFCHYWEGEEECDDITVPETTKDRAEELPVGSYTIEQRPGDRWGVFRGGMRVGQRWAEDEWEAVRFIEEDVRERFDAAMADLQEVAGHRTEMQRREIEARDGVPIVSTPFGFFRAEGQPRGPIGPRPYNTDAVEAVRLALQRFK